MGVKQRKGDRKNVYNAQKHAKFDEKIIICYMQDQCTPKRINSKTFKSRLKIGKLSN